MDRQMSCTNCKVKSTNNMSFEDLGEKSYCLLLVHSPSSSVRETWKLKIEVPKSPD